MSHITAHPEPRDLTVYKMNGSGNDFVFIDGRQSPADGWLPRRIAGICDRHRGVGADGLVVLTPRTPPNSVRMDYWNADLRKAVRAMIHEVESKPCVNVGGHDGGVYACRQISGLGTDEFALATACVAWPGLLFFW